ncbi:hypothetical protein MUG84_26855 [Paenibacillus sp. KQZ6P-2]|uniref:Uncharacterized protein n=1 Tax=Paenibacillus mangrovi TaxID=2931978 RepID=A0A9X1WVG1_9BACL|nr:hypothetical protein [Paenibacillus mangrovi]MCJ8015291.1 hypothetical protein [Paenibacillus mangrovi]
MKLWLFTPVSVLLLMLLGGGTSSSVAVETNHYDPIEQTIFQNYRGGIYTPDGRTVDSNILLEEGITPGNSQSQIQRDLVRRSLWQLSSLKMRTDVYTPDGRKITDHILGESKP